MKFAIAKEHRDFFQKQGWVEFENFFSTDQIAQINESMTQVLMQRFKLPQEKLRFYPSEDFYLHGRDLWRGHSELARFASMPRLAEIASELVQKKPLRLGYDQLLPKEESISSVPGQIYAPFLKETASLAEVSCMSGILCGLLISLGGESVSQEKKLEGADIFPSQPGNVSFFQSEFPINWSMISNHPGQNFYLIVYTQMRSLYLLQPKDPHTHDLKKLEYVFNDKLNDRTHPIVYR